MKKRYVLIGGVAMLLTYGFFSPGIFSGGETRVAYIESAEITKRFGEWQEAQQRIDAATNAWKKEFERMQASLQAKQDSLEKYRLIWSPPEKQDMEKSIAGLKADIQQYWTKKFGPLNSEYSQLNHDVMSPIYEKIFAAVQETAKEDKYDYVFDKTGEVLLLYANPDNDLTREVMEKLGIKDTSKTNLPQHPIPGQPGQQGQRTMPGMPGGQQNPYGGAPPPPPYGGGQQQPH